MYFADCFKAREKGAMTLSVNASNAIKIVAKDSNVSSYISDNYEMPDWKVVRATLIYESVYELNGSKVLDGENIRKVEILERTCACSSVSELYVVEGYVSASTGEILGIEKKLVSEKNYENATFSSTVCH